MRTKLETKRVKTVTSLLSRMGGWDGWYRRRSVLLTATHPVPSIVFPKLWNSLYQSPEIIWTYLLHVAEFILVYPLHRGWCFKFAIGLNGRFTTISSHFVANYIDIFHKTVVQTVILRCWTSLYLNWFKSYATNTKNEKNIIQISAFFYKIATIQKQKYLCFVS